MEAEIELQVHNSDIDYTGARECILVYICTSALHKNVHMHIKNFDIGYRWVKSDLRWKQYGKQKLEKIPNHSIRVFLMC